VKTANVQCDNVQPFSSGGLILPAPHFVSTNHNRIVHTKLSTQSKTLLLTTTNCSLHTRSSFVLGRSAA